MSDLAVPTAGPLAALEHANRMLAEAETVDEVKAIRDKAEALRAYAKQAGLGLGMQNRCAELKIRAERRTGELLAVMELRGGDRRSESRSHDATLKALGLTKYQSHRYQAIAALPGDVFEEHVADTQAKAKVDNKTELTSADLLKLATKQRRQEVEHTAARPDAALPDADSGDDRVRLLHGDFRDRLAELEPGSVDLILTDPPYPKDDLPLWWELAEVAAKLLGPRGLLVAYTGQLFLPQVLSMLGDHLTYGWTFCLDMPGASSRIMGRHIIQAWKPVVAFSTGTWPSGEWADDVLRSPSREKGTYEWQQNAVPAGRLIERFTAPDGLVVDPFLGVGTFGVAARKAGRRFVGCELDAGRFTKASAVVLGP